MRSPREKQREARLLVIVAALAGDDGAQAIDVFALDFLLQHPSILAPYLRGAKADLPSDAAPGAAEAESSEEALLRWKRSVSGRVLAPMVGRLIARGLICRAPSGRFAPTSRGVEVVNNLGGAGGSIDGLRLPRLAAHISQNPVASRRALLAALKDAP
jgi:hypothetical protein